MNHTDLTLSLYSENIDSGTSRESPGMEEAKRQGFDEKLYNQMFHPHHKKKQNTSDTAAGNANYTHDVYNERAVGTPMPASYYLEKMGGAMPPPLTSTASSTTGDKQKNQEHKPYYPSFGNWAERIYKTAIMKFKDTIYKMITQAPIWARDQSIKFINRLGKYFDIGSSILELGMYSGAFQVAIDDYKNRIDMYFEENPRTKEKIIRGFRLWTDRNPKAYYIQMLRKEHIEMGEEPVPRGGRKIKKGDLKFDDSGRITGFTEGSNPGGELERLSRINYDIKYFSESNADKVASAYLENEGVNLTTFRKNLLYSTAYYYLHHKGSANVFYLQDSPTKNSIYCLEFPYSLRQIDPGLIGYTLFEAIPLILLKKPAKWLGGLQELADAAHRTPVMEEIYGGF